MISSDGLIIAYCKVWPEEAGGDSTCGNRDYNLRLHHAELTAALDELCAEYVMRTGRSLAVTSVAELLRWSHSVVYDV